jgi:hypothetical protein
MEKSLKALMWGYFASNKISMSKLEASQRQNSFLGMFENVIL